MADPVAFTEIRFTIPGPPKAWGRTQNRIVTSAKTGKQFVSSYTPARTRSEEGVVRYLASRAMGDTPPHDGPVSVTLAFLMGIPVSFTKTFKHEALNGWRFPTSKPDWDNLSKLVTDGMNGIVYLDDKQIVTAFITKRYSEQPAVLVSVKALQVGEPRLKV